MTGTAVITIAHGRHDHLALQRAGLRASTRPVTTHVVVAMDDPDLGAGASSAPPVQVVHVGRAGAALPLALARNTGAAAAIAGGADLLIFLDVDCVPAPGLVAAYEAAAGAAGRDLLCGPVAYLPPPGPTGYDLGHLDQLAEPHPDRPAPAPGELVRDDEHHHLFWSLSFAITAAQWQALGGFHEGYVGYGGEDTDFAFVARAAGRAIVWVGGARAFHQHHRVSSPPVEHLEDIVQNATLFHQRWGVWPMIGWLTEFEQLGLIHWSGDVLDVTDRSASTEGSPSCRHRV